MSELRTLYQEMILDHGRHPRNFHVMAQANRETQGFNQLCGDHITLYLKIENHTIQAISFMGSGCAISIASASLMSEALKGKTDREARWFFKAFQTLLTGTEEQKIAPKDLKKLMVFSNVKDYPVRVKCATLAWHTLLAGLNKQKDTIVSTENK